ncbi:hypothetical protein [Priestia endophytica]|uniref:hypothetical protein n=1 Tax=Priestia endophytica TaxID=135735 RepID=UPI00178C2B68|nr:hypothetical protein [Priestia endophytica]
MNNWTFFLLLLFIGISIVSSFFIENNGVSDIIKVICFLAVLLTLLLSRRKVNHSEE